MKPTSDQIKRATQIYRGYNGTTEESLAEVLGDFAANLFKPGAITTLEVGAALPPARDYRKELWIAHWASVPADLPLSKAVSSAERAVAAFDKFFGEKP